MSAPPPLANADDAAIDDAARALSTGDALRALGLVGRAASPLGLALRGVAYAQLGDLDLAKEALAAAARSTDDPRLRARVNAARVEVALAEGDAARAAREARASSAALLALGDPRNAAMQRLVEARAEVLLGRLGEARRAVDEALRTDPPADVRGVALLAEAEIASRALAARDAASALERARRAWGPTPHRLLAREVERMGAELATPVARLERHGSAVDADLFAVEEATNGALFVVDACRRLVVAGRARIPLGKRPVLFGLLLALARGLPNPVAREALAQRVFGARRLDDSHRGRLRVEIGRLRQLLDEVGAEPVATPEGYVLRSQREVAVLLPREEGEAARVALLLGDGASWSAQRVADSAGISKRTAQRALADLVAQGRAERTGAGRAVAYHRPGSPIASRMLLLGLAPTVGEDRRGDRS